MIFNLKIGGIIQGTHKLSRTPTLKKKNDQYFNLSIPGLINWEPIIGNLVVARSSMSFAAWGWDLEGKNAVALVSSGMPGG